jgi:hypothetical protein
VPAGQTGNTLPQQKINQQQQHNNDFVGGGQPTRPFSVWAEFATGFFLLIQVKSFPTLLVPTFKVSSHTAQYSASSALVNDAEQ